MRRLDTLDLHTDRAKTIEYWQGDLTTSTDDPRIDAIVVSAFNGDYTPTPTSVIGALEAQGVSVADLAVCKDIDLLDSFGCWLSKPFPIGTGATRRILCFEPKRKGEPPEVVGDLFRALTPVLAVRPDIQTLAIPLLSTGDMGYPVDRMVDAILGAALRWMELGLQLDRILLVGYSDEKTSLASERFAAAKSTYQSEAPPPISDPDYDVFISYAHANADKMNLFHTELTSAMPGVRVFVDRHELQVGASWQVEIFRSIDRCRKVAVLLSPEYVLSQACEEEFNLAWMRARNTKRDMLFPVYIASADLPTYMLFKQYHDCRNDDGPRLAEAAKQLAATLRDEVHSVRRAGGQGEPSWPARQQEGHS